MLHGNVEVKLSLAQSGFRGKRDETRPVLLVLTLLCSPGPRVIEHSCRVSAYRLDTYPMGTHAYPIIVYLHYQKRLH